MICRSLCFLNLRDAQILRKCLLWQLWVCVAQRTTSSSSLTTWKFLNMICLRVFPVFVICTIDSNCRNSQT